MPVQTKYQKRMDARIAGVSRTVRELRSDVAGLTDEPAPETPKEPTWLQKTLIEKLIIGVVASVVLVMFSNYLSLTNEAARKSNFTVDLMVASQDELDDQIGSVLKLLDQSANTPGSNPKLASDIFASRRVIELELRKLEALSTSNQAIESDILTKVQGAALAAQSENSAGHEAIADELLESYGFFISEVKKLVAQEILEGSRFGSIW
ncbi:MAG: hypothetical protein AAFQ38_18160 [Pseudomonadota bacterium]